METAIGVFAARERAENAVKRLLEEHVPKDAIVYLTLSESEAKSVGRQLGAYAGGLVGGAAGLSAGVAAASLLAIPGLGPVFALGFGAAALLGLVGAGTGATVGAHKSSDAPAPTSSVTSAKDAAYFREVLNEGHSLIVVRTESARVATSACQILDELGISMTKGATQKCKVTTRELGVAIVADVVGRIALADGTAMVRDAVRALTERGTTRIVMNLAEVDFIDSAGLGELVRMHASVRSHGGKLVLVNPNKNVSGLFQMTKLDRVLEIEADEAGALKLFEKGSAGAPAVH